MAEALKALLLALAVLSVCLAAATAAPAAPAHSNPCHTKHVCPSDHATYRWKGLLCVKPTSPKRTAAFKKRVVYAGKPYFCKK